MDIGHRLPYCISSYGLIAVPVRRKIFAYFAGGAQEVARHCGPRQSRGEVSTSASRAGAEPVQSPDPFAVGSYSQSLDPPEF